MVGWCGVRTVGECLESSSSIWEPHIDLSIRCRQGLKIPSFGLQYLDLKSTCICWMSCKS